MTAAVAKVRKSDPAIREYHSAIRTFAEHNAAHEGATETAFARLLAATARPRGWTLIPKKGMKAKDTNKQIFPDGTLEDDYFLPRGYWEAKDTADDLDAEIKKKIAAGYPLTNIIFEDTRQAALYQNGKPADAYDLADPARVADLLNDFFAYTEPDIRGFDQAVREFAGRVKDLGKGLVNKIREGHAANPAFQRAFAKFFDLCRAALNPDLRRDAVDEMLAQHLLTERLFRTVFGRPDFARKNAIAAEVEAVVDALVSTSFSRTDFLKGLDRFYRAIELAAATLDDFADKQHFLNTVYERFFQGYSVEVADTHGIVYTPQPIVDFMCASVVDVLKAEFGQTLGSPGVRVLDPCTGTGNFVVNLVRRASPLDLPDLYRKRLFANEVMLLPYYIAALNIEHAYHERTGRYEPFDGLCFADTLDLVFERQRSLFGETNTERVSRQMATEITVILGNPPYNAHQLNENDNNRNRKYDLVDARVSGTYVRNSSARLRAALSDAYVRFFRWAADRLDRRPGIVCFVSNNGFVNGKAFDGFRKHLLQDFDLVYHLDTLGNARTSGEERRRQAGNVFNDQVRVGVGITLLVRRPKPQPAKVLFHALPEHTESGAKLEAITRFGSVSKVPWRELNPSHTHDWFPPTNLTAFDALLPIGSHDWKAGKKGTTGAIFREYCRGVATNADAYVYDWDRDKLAARTAGMVEDFNAQLDRWKRSGGPKAVEDFLKVDEKVHKWVRKTKKVLLRGQHLTFDPARIRRAMYRPFDRQWYFLDRNFSEDIYRFPTFFPGPTAESENRLIAISDIAYRSPGPSTFCCNSVVDLHLCASLDSHQCFPFYVYGEDGTERRENITDWALKQFRGHYKDKKLTKWDIFHYVYAVLHHPGYRAKFADNLKKSLPRIPFAPDFRAFAAAGERLADLHVGYERADPYPLEAKVADGLPLSWAVGDRMKLSKDRTELRVNPSLTLAGIPPEAFDYRLGNRSALEWVIDQYRVTEDKRSGVRSDPNRPDAPEYIVGLVRRVVTVSVETVRIVGGLPAGFGG